MLSRRTFLQYGFCGGAAALLSSYPFLIERNIVQVNRYRVPVAGLPPSFNGFTLAHLTDLHHGPLVSDAFIRNVVHKTNSLKADAIVCTGDYVHADNTRNETDRVWPILSSLTAREGVYAVLGNHDHWADYDRSMSWLQRTGQDVRHQCKAIYRGRERILIGGSGDYWEDELGIDKAFANSDRDDCRVLLSHNPDAIDTDFHTPVALVISGHTHGGQVVIPFLGPPKLPVKNKRYSSGLISTRNTRLFISRGIGWAIYPVRFNCYPEIALLELVNASRRT